MAELQDIAPLRAWIGRAHTDVDTLHDRDALRLAAALHQIERAPQHGQPLPTLWHWACFAPIADGRELGVDGHPARGGFLPPVELPRRMWAGGDLVIEQPPRVGERLRRTSRIVDVQARQGRSGALVFVTVQHEITGDSDGLTRLRERQDIVYRGLAGAGATTAPVEVGTLPEHFDWQCSMRPDPVMLFRYSATTFNGHRIHYDTAHAVQTEGYRGLVVHGPLTATLLADAFERRLGRGSLKRFAFKAVSPAFVGEELILRGRSEGEGRHTLWATDAGHQRVMNATAWV